MFRIIIITIIIIIIIIIIANPSAQAWYDTRSVFKLSLTGFRVFLLLD